MDSPHDDDDQLFGWLKEAMSEAGAVPRDFVEAGKSVYTWHDIDAELATVAFDSAVVDGRVPVAVRADRTSRRNLTFHSANLTVEVEIDRHAVRGQIVPPGSDVGEITIQTVVGGNTTMPIDELGYFATASAPRSTFRLRCRLADGATLVTSWIAP